MKPLAAVVLVLMLATGAWATPITYTVAYTAGGAGVPDFTFAFTHEGYITTTGMFTLPEPVTFETGVGAPQSFTIAGTNATGWWVFGFNGSAGISDGGGHITSWMGCSYSVGPCAMFSPTIAGYITSPGTRTGTVVGQTLWSWDSSTVARMDGRFTLTVTEAPAPAPRLLTPTTVPESGIPAPAMALGLVALMGWRRRVTPMQEAPDAP